MKISLAFLTLPILFSGCMQEKVSAVNPESIDNNHTKITKKEVKPLKSPSKLKTLNVNNGITLLPDTNKTNLMTDDATILNELALTIQNDTDDSQFYGTTESTTDSIEVEENWVELTKQDEIIETAKEYLGVPYIWAANGPFSFDCSGFTKYVYKKNGITLPRYSGYQANVGLKVSFDELQEGDLVFFDTSKGFHRKVNHVGIYIGNHQFIHASSAQKKVVISSFDRKIFYRNRFLEGRRVVDNDRSFASYETKESTYTN